MENELDTLLAALHSKSRITNNQEKRLRKSGIKKRRAINQAMKWGRGKRVTIEWSRISLSKILHLTLSQY